VSSHLVQCTDGSRRTPPAELALAWVGHPATLGAFPIMRSTSRLRVSLFFMARTHPGKRIRGLQLAQ
jgi:hypothetical protein